MDGCTINAGETECTYPSTGRGDCSFTAHVDQGVGQSSDKSTTVTLSGVSGTCRPRIAIAEGNTGANFCSFFFPDGIEDTGAQLFTKSKQGKTVAHRGLAVCTDRAVELPTVLEPIISLETTVVRAIDGIVECNDPLNEPTDRLNVIAPTIVGYCHTVTIQGGGIDDLEIIDDQGTSLLELGNSLGGGDTILAKSELVEITSVGEIITTAIVSGTFQGGGCSGCEDSDTVTINVVVECDSSTQGQADDTGTVVETYGLGRITRCSPAATLPVTDVRSVSLLCDGSCEVRPECVGDGVNPLPAHCKQPCKPSGNWTHEEYDSSTSTTTCVTGVPSNKNLPLCGEVITLPNNNEAVNIGDPADCSRISNPAILNSDGNGTGYRSNPLLYYFPASGGGNSVGTIYCILLAGESASVCPSGSIVY